MRKRALNSKNIKILDKAKMLDLLLDFPQQCRIALDLARNAKVSFEKRDFNKVVFVGLGGSAIGADLVKAYLYFESKLPILVLREYEIPAYVDSSTLVFISSYSGNTEETLSAYAQAKARFASLIAISSGGKLEESALANKVNFISIPSGLPPRCALGYMSIIPLALLAKLGLIKEVDYSVREVVGVLGELRDNCLRPGVGSKDNIAKYIAGKLFNKFSIIYSASVHFDVAATRLRSQLNENSKALAASHLFPEMNHNEIVGWQNPKKMFKDFVVLMLRDKTMHERVAKRMDITAEVLNKEGVNILEVWSKGKDLLSRIFSLIYIGDFISYYLAILYGIDPTPVEKVTYLKNKLAGIK